MTDISYTVTPIPIQTLQSAGFSPADVAGVNHYVQEDSYPWLYGNDKYKRPAKDPRRVIAIKDIVEDGAHREAFLEQPTRTVKNPQYSAIRGDITTNGYALTSLPPAVRLVTDEDTGNETYYRIDGGTRFEILDSLGVENVICDVFEIDNVGDFSRLGQMYNHYHKPFGEGSTIDIEECLKQLNEKIGDGGLDLPWKGGLTNISHADPAKFKIRWEKAAEVLEIEANSMTVNRFKRDQISRLVANVINDSSKQKMIVKFNNGGRIKDYLAQLGHKDNSRIKYVPFSGTENAKGKLLESIATNWKHVEAHERNELRVVLYCGSPNATDPEGSWLKATIEFKKEFDEFEGFLSKTRFKGGSVNDNQVSIYGAIPQIRFMEKDYPMDDLHYFE